jgi:hypothetical protein
VQRIEEGGREAMCIGCRLALGTKQREEETEKVREDLRVTGVRKGRVDALVSAVCMYSRGSVEVPAIESLEGGFLPSFP